MEQPLNSVVAELQAEFPNSSFLLLDRGAFPISSIGNVPRHVAWSKYVPEGKTVQVMVEKRRYIVHKRQGLTLVQSS
ncbi:hypothetical protein GGF31_000213 [Allomyces arbusculus]|nr:hypothetical protein GGF31_000213 [Allomyces arbusculus]